MIKLFIQEFLIFYIFEYEYYSIKYHLNNIKEINNSALY